MNEWLALSAVTLIIVWSIAFLVGLLYYAFAGRSSANFRGQEAVRAFAMFLAFGGGLSIISVSQLLSDHHS
jgi:hypothetical protein